MGELRYPQWQKTYHDALLELNPQKLVRGECGGNSDFVPLTGNTNWFG
jgi:hypothetical protein